MNKRRSIVLLCALTTMLGTMRFAAAEPVSQIVALEAGWNAVFFEVEPTDTDPAVVFASLGDKLLSVWTWNPNAGTVEFIQNPAQLIPSSPQMLNYQPDDPDKIVTNLHAIRGNKAYLINVTVGTTLTVTGEPKVPNINWKPNSLNFVGFHVDAVSPPLYHAFFDPSSAHNGSLVAGRSTPESTPEIYVLRVDEDELVWTMVDSSVPMKKGEAFWIYTQGSSEFNGPISVQLERADGLSYGDTLTRQDIVFKNDSDEQQSIALSLSDAPANLDLFYWTLNAGNTFEWVAFPPADRVIAPGQSERLTLGVKRAGLTSADSLSANIDVTNKAGSVFQIPLSVEGIDVAGLWVGQAVVNKVSEVKSETSETTPAGSEFSFRIIVHVDNGGQAKLLSHVIQMWDEDIPGPVLFTSDALIPNYTGTTLRDGKAVGRRISAPAFNSFGQSALDGSFGTQAGSLTTTLNLPANDPTNPFIHRYHKDHLVPGDDTPPEQMYSIERRITLTFLDKDADGNNIVGSSGLGWGSSDMGGIYEETIKGIHREDLTIKGTFLLHRVSEKGELE